MDEAEKIKERYERRKSIPQNKYSLSNPDILMRVQEKERKILKLLRNAKLVPLSDKKILEVGCGTGANLLEFIRFGANPTNIIGNDLLQGRIETAKNNLPQDVRLICCEASELNLQDNQFDIVLQSTMFSSILDLSLQKQIAEKMWHWTKPGGYIIWHDIIHANPYNRDVISVKLRDIKELFPKGIFKIKKTTLFPFIAEKITARFYFPYTLCNMLPFFRMHILCFIQKPSSTDKI